MSTPELKSERVTRTIEKLRSRIAERLPKSGLSETCAQLYAIARESDEIVEWIGRPNYLMRGLIVIFVAAMFAGLVYSVSQLDFETDNMGLGEFVQMTEAALNEVILIGAGIVFLVTFENRRKRKRVITATNKLRCLAHIIDAHQLTKDPDRIAEAYVPTQSSPRPALGDYELGRYLDYCSEMLSLIAKLAFLFVPNFNDPAANNAVNDLEDLTNGISRKIWQKIMVLRTQKPKAVS
jgi:hypothetical protein